MRKHRLYRFLHIAIILALLLSGAGPMRVEANLPLTFNSSFVLGEVLVKFKPGTLPSVSASGVDMGTASLNTLARQYGVTAAEPLFPDSAASDVGLERIYKLSLSPTADVIALVEALTGDPNVEYAEPNYVYHILAKEEKPNTQSSRQCDPQVYFGVQHCTDDNGDTHIIIVNLNDPNVRVQTVLSSTPNGIECNSVNHIGKDPTSNCPSPYPFETPANMLRRYVSAGAVAIINTDYFGQDGDHGAEGLTVRNGQRLDGAAHGDNDGNATKRSSLAFSATKAAIIGKPVSESAINTNGAYYNVVAGGPTIVRDGQALGNDACSESSLPVAVCTRTIQSAAGLTTNGELVLVTANDRDAAGVAGYLTSTYGAQSALKFDGGGSAQLAWLDEGGQVQSYDPSGEGRRVAEGLLIFSMKIPGPVNPSDPLFSYQWNLHNTSQTGGKVDADIDAPEAWGIITGTNGVMIAVIDTGVYYTHDDLNDGRVRTDIDWDYVNNDSDALDDNGHGTHVAGIIAAETNNGFGTAGVMWQARILPLKVCNNKGECNTDHIARAIRYAADQGARVINMSLGGGCSSAIADAVNYAHFNKGVMVVAAAGNNSGSILFPAAHDPVIAVGATDKDDKRAWFSNQGERLDVVAPGVNIHSTVPKNGHDTMSGTSMASPHVAGVVGLLLAQRPELTNNQIRDILRQSADDLGPNGFDKEYGYGRVNAYRALQTVAPANPKPPQRAESCPVCGASAAAADGPDGQSLLTTVRAVRDQVFTQDPGKRWARIYYEHQFEVAWLVMSDSQLRAEVLEGMRAYDPIFQALLNDDPTAPTVALTPELIETARRVMMGVAERGSPAVHDVIVQEWERVNPDRFAGWDVREVWEQLRLENQASNQLYLPLIRK